jgi:hypothetical protein
MKDQVSVNSRRDDAVASPVDAGSRARRWISPRIQTLPRLTEITLQSGGIPGGGGTGGGGSTVVP